MTCCAADFNKSGAEHPDSQAPEPPLYCEAQGGQDCSLNQRLLPTLYTPVLHLQLPEIQ